MTLFASLGLSEPLLRAVRDTGYETATPIQAQAIPVILEGRDILAAAQTGTGKTAGFTLPLLQLLSTRGEPAKNRTVRALVLTPTRELAAQVAESVSNYGQYLQLRSAVVFGGVSINPQMMKLRGGVDVLVATPGRLLDLQGQRAVDLSQVEILVLDEADRMLDMGFIHDIRRVLKLLPAKRQNLLFSATFSNEIRDLTKGLLHNPASIEVAPRNTTATLVTQAVYQIDKGDKNDLLSHLITAGAWEQVLVFTRTKHGANKLAQYLERNGISSAAIHGNKSQGARTRALADFKAGAVRVLVATDIAARGLDIEQLPHVVNYELPNVPEDYVHRIGRTGRAGASGEAISLVSQDERKLLVDIERLLKRKVDVLAVPHFERSAKAVQTSDDESRREQRPPRQSQPQQRNRPPRANGEGGNNRRPQGNDSRGNGNSARGNNSGNSASGNSARSGAPRSNAPRSNASGSSASGSNTNSGRNGGGNGANQSRSNGNSARPANGNTQSFKPSGNGNSQRRRSSSPQG
jgi:ATP-dependent RNA helicase RhlE